MNRRLLVLRSLAYYWRTNAAVVLGVATAVAVLAGALLVGDSVRGTLSDLALGRLGATDLVVTSPTFFREGLAGDLQADPSFRTHFSAVVPLIAMPSAVTAQTSGRRAGEVLVYGVDDRFWRFHDVANVTGPKDRDAMVSAALAAETGLAVGDAALVRVERLSAVPLESLHGDKEGVGRTLRLTVSRVLGPDALGEFSLQPRQGEVRAVFVPIARLQDELELGPRANVLLASFSAGGGTVATNALEVLLRDYVQLEDVGLKLRPVPDRHAVSVESEAGLLDAAQASAVNAAVESTLLEPRSIFTYLANAITIGERSVPYSLVSAVDLPSMAPRLPTEPDTPDPPIVLNDWAARDLDAKVGDRVRLDYYLWEDPGRLVTRTADFRLAGVVPVSAADREYAPAYSGITDAATVDAWDPPFPIDLKRIRRIDEAYWTAHRTTPKAFIPLDVGQRLWGSRYGALTSIRLGALPGRSLDETVRAFDERLRSKIDPIALGMSVADVRRAARDAASGTTDFGEYFLYFSGFLVIAALVLAALFFKLGVEQRVREVGLLNAVGVEPSTVRNLFIIEAALLAVVGSVVGVVGAVAYGWLVVAGLGTWWFDAVGTRALVLHVSPSSMLWGALGGLAAALVCTTWTLRHLGGISARRLLAGELSRDAVSAAAGGSPRPYLWASVAFTGIGGVLVAASMAGGLDRSGAFFGAAAALLVAALCVYAFWYRLPPRGVLHGRSWRSVARLGLRNASYRPGRSVLSIGVIASATFILISVDAFRRDRTVETSARSGVGGFDLVIESLLPIVHDLNGADGRRELNLAGLEGATVEPFRLRPGDDASCLNLYVPQNPRILGARDDFLAAGRFTFQGSLASTAEEHANPWRLLQRTFSDGAIPVIADNNSMTYVLHRALGEDMVVKMGERSIHLRLVGALRDSIFQSELVMSEANFRTLFPDREGYQVWLIDAPPGREAALSDELENALVDYGVDVTTTSARLAAFHRVENTYLSTFQTLGGLGLLVGTLGLAAVLLRNALERRRELALLAAVGYRRWHFVLMLTSESLSWLVGGLFVGAATAVIATAPALLERGARLPLSGASRLLLVIMLVGGLISTVVAARLATRTPLVPTLRSEA